MAGDTLITVIGNLTADPELRFTPAGAAVASFTIASTPRSFDKVTNEWKDGEALFLRCSLWRQAAENACEALVRGTRVIAAGRLVQRSYTTKQGEARTVIELQVEEIGPSLRYATAIVRRAERRGDGREQVAHLPAAGTADPWAAGPSGDHTDEPPFHHPPYELGEWTTC